MNIAGKTRSDNSGVFHPPLPPLLAEALEAMRGIGFRRAVFCVVFPLPAETVQALLADEGVAGLLVRDPPPASVIGFPGRVGAYPPESGSLLVLRTCRAPLVLVGLRTCMPRRLLILAVQAGIFRLLTMARDGWGSRRVAELLMEASIRSAQVITIRLILRVLSRIGMHFPYAERLARRLNSAPATDRFIASIAAPRESDPAGVVFYTGSLGAGGAERQMIETVLGLQQRGIGPLRVVCATSADGFYRPTLDAAGVPVDLVRGDAAIADISLGALNLPSARSLQAFPCAVILEILTLQAYLRQVRPQVLHCWQDHSNIFGGVAGLLAGVPSIVLSTRSLAPYHFGFFQPEQRPVYRALYRRTEVSILNNSAAGAADYEDWAGLPKGSISVVRNGVDARRLPSPADEAVAAFRAAYGIPRDAPVVGTIFTFYPVKRPLLWLETARRLAIEIPDVHFLMVGDGRMRSQIEYRIRRYGLQDRVHLTGRCVDVSLPLAIMQAFLLTSRIEGLPNVLLEAQAMGVPVVTAAVGGAPEAVEDGVTGIVVREATAVALATALKRVLREPSWNRCPSAGPAFVKRRFGRRRMIDETLASYGMPTTALALRDDPTDA